jgi:hypothetical protein
MVCDLSLLHTDVSGGVENKAAQYMPMGLFEVREKNPQAITPAL